MDKEVKITILTENTSGKDGLEPEYGLSMWIEADGTRILFDTGMTGAFASNAEALGIDPSAAVHLVLSHGHIDHTGGVRRAMELCPEVDDHLHPDAAGPEYLAQGAGSALPIGMPGPLSAACTSPARTAIPCS